jgi:undecaprenyl-diphosphatase
MIPTGALFYFASFQRVNERKHYVSDVVGAFFLSAFASEGVRVAHGHKKNHPFYKLIFEHDFKVGLYRHKDAVGPLVYWSF